MKKIWDFIRPKTEKERIEEYLSQSVDHVDLEQRMKEIDRYQATFPHKLTGYGFRT